MRHGVKLRKVELVFRTETGFKYMSLTVACNNDRTGELLTKVSPEMIFVDYTNCIIKDTISSSSNNNHTVKAWIEWGANESPNRAVGIFAKVAGAPSNTNSWTYFDGKELMEQLKEVKGNPRFRGVIVWDAPLAETNGGYQYKIKEALKP